MSDPEAHFLLLWQAAGGAHPEQEFRFHPLRKWRADFALPDRRVLIEIEGGAFSRGRHTRGTGFANDAEKYLAATLAGWTVIRLIPQQLNLTTIETILSWTLSRQIFATASSATSSSPKAGIPSSSPPSKKCARKSKTPS